jgi:SWI/SNF-related matrix-associated actin-dependent regulator 1 of chromatin subfamily A
VQALAFLRMLQRRDGRKGPHLVVAPASVVENWRREVARWLPDFACVVYQGSQAERRDVRKNFQRLRPDVVIATYTVFERDSCKDDRAFLHRQDFFACVFDEAHALKNARSKRYQHLAKLRGERRLLLSGTPIQNNLEELSALLVFCFPGVFKGARFDPSQLEPGRARRLLAPFVLRRLKADVLARHLTPKTEQVMLLDMLPAQAEAYGALAQRLAETKSAKAASHLANFTELRKVANHPLLARWRYAAPDALRGLVELALRHESFGPDAGYAAVEKELAGWSDFELSRLCAGVGGEAARAMQLPREECLSSCKARALAELLPQLVGAGHHVLLFSQWTTILDVLETLVQDVLGLGSFRLDGDTDVAARQDMVDAFNAGQGASIFLLSTKAGGLGLNLTRADTVILHDVDWSVTNDLQAEDRAHRIGQTRTVRVIKLVTKGTADEALYKVSESKRGLDKVVITELAGQRDALLLPCMPEELQAADASSSALEHEEIGVGLVETALALAAAMAADVRPRPADGAEAHDPLDLTL